MRWLKPQAIVNVKLKTRAAFAALVLLPLLAHAQTVGPAQVAVGALTPWPDPLNQIENFNRASRAALIIYLIHLHRLHDLPDATIMAKAKIKSVNRIGLDQWFEQEKKQAFSNYQYAAVDCSSGDWSCFPSAKNAAELITHIDASTTVPPNNYVQWNHNMNDFARVYIGEQMRLAALFPKVTSEINTFSKMEWTGVGFPDRHFYLTFDDGPSTAKNGATDATLTLLNAHHKSAVFFVLGDNLQRRATNLSNTAIKKLYGQQCVALHGWEHQSHSQWEAWQDSVKRTKNLVDTLIDSNNVLPLFRPPYGQRTENSGDFFKQQNLQVALWNIDSQDWNSTLDATAIENRIILLMLIKRHGVLLFHDIHSKAKQALPNIFAQLGNSVLWPDCRTLPPSHAI